MQLKDVTRWSFSKKQLTKLKIYIGDKRPHEIQKPKIIDFSKLNKNIVKINGKYCSSPTANKKMNLISKTANMPLEEERDQ